MNLLNYNALRKYRDIRKSDVMSDVFVSMFKRLSFFILRVYLFQEGIIVSVVGMFWIVALSQNYGYNMDILFYEGFSLICSICWFLGSERAVAPQNMHALLQIIKNSFFISKKYIVIFFSVFLVWISCWGLFLFYPFYNFMSNFYI